MEEIDEESDAFSRNIYDTKESKDIRYLGNNQQFGVIRLNEKGTKICLLYFGIGTASEVA